MSFEILNYDEGKTSNGTIGTVYTYHVVGAIGDSVRFEGTNFETWTNPVEIVTFALTTNSEAVVVSHTWKHIRAVQLIGTPSYVVCSDLER